MFSASPRAFLLAATVATLALSPLSQAAPEHHGVDLAGIDRTVKPGDDFFGYANGSWFKSAQIPPDRNSLGVFANLNEASQERTVELIKGMRADAPAGSNERKIADYYGSFMDEASIEAAGLKALQPRLQRIAAITDRKSLSTVLGTTLRHDVDPLNNTNYYTDNLFGLWVAPDFADPSIYGAYLLQGGLGMNERTNYLSDSPRMVELRAKYKAHIVNVLTLAKIDDAAKKADAIFDLETKIAKAHVTAEESHDVSKANNRWARADFAAKAPGLDWEAYFAAANLGKQADFIVWQPSAFTGLSALVASEPVDVWKDYLTYHTLDHESAFLPKAFADERFAFYGTAVSGTPQQRERAKRAVVATDAALGEAVGQFYVAKYFPPEAKVAAEKMVKNIVAAFGKRVDRLDWMTPATKAQAKAKLAAMYVGVGYPEKWRDYSGLEVVRGDAAGNHIRAEQFELQTRLNQLGRQVDKTEWQMNPQLVNAVNLPIQNALNFPAAILQPPFFDPKASDAANYGGIGTTIGHEISHSFDASGALFDATGKLSNWWTDADLKQFEAASAKLAAQYDQYKPFPDARVNGKLTLDENIADVAGINASYDAWKAATNGKAPTVDGLTGDQQFFLAWGQVWRSKVREAALRQSLLTNGHAPSEFRADTVRNLDAWYKTFPVKAGDKLYLDSKDRVRIW
ncbi:M13 family metallopeptidase [Roseiterribacter gracilis]|uniref:Peptidase M13 n=1 Tax=Roseiterribacter gracilis TaxID=2812848 RepID=A0A8S8XBN4_9PROT|nr:peptidase M13 [Rhodospirillales bacterium TMPK1]